MVLHEDEACPAVPLGDALRLRELPGEHAAGADLAGLPGPHHVVQRLHGREARSPPRIRVPQPSKTSAGASASPDPGTRRRSRNVTVRKIRLVTGRQHNPG